MAMEDDSVRDSEIWARVARKWYRMAMEDDNVRDREVWAQVARQWYLKSANRSLTTGRLYHHLAILAFTSRTPRFFLGISASFRNICGSRPDITSRHQFHVTPFIPLA